MELPCRYPYNPRWQMILFGAAFFGAGGVFMAHKAMHNSAGLIINGIITLGPTGAIVFYWVIAAACGVFVLGSLIFTIRRVVSPKVLELGTDALILPHGFLQTKVARVPYSEIQSLSEAKVSGQTFLYITAGVRRFTITASLLGESEIYLAVKSFLASRAPH